jgi:hypothetical protein
MEIKTPVGNPPYLSPRDFIQLAGNRGKKLWLDQKKWRKWGIQSMTDGEKSYTLPRVLPGGLMESELVLDLLQFFFGDDDARLLALDFHVPDR